jgi:hypothetical protein
MQMNDGPIALQWTDDDGPPVVSIEIGMSMAVGDQFTVTRRLRGWRLLWARVRGKPATLTELFVVTASASGGY